MEGLAAQETLCSIGRGDKHERGGQQDAYCTHQTSRFQQMKEYTISLKK